MDWIAFIASHQSIRVCSLGTTWGDSVKRNTEHVAVAAHAVPHYVRGRMCFKILQIAVTIVTPAELNEFSSCKQYKDVLFFFLLY